MKKINEKKLSQYRDFLIKEEKSPVTVAQYLRGANAFLQFTDNCTITKGTVLSYKQSLQEKYTNPRSVNAGIASVNHFLTFLHLEHYKVKSLKLQKHIYTDANEELTKEEYLRLLQTAKKDPRLYLIIETICATGIRVSELQYFTVESVSEGIITVNCKSKTRNILVPRKLQEKLLRYCASKRIGSGYVFRTRNGTPIDRTNIWNQMKSICEKAEVDRQKVFPHNLRKLFARTFYSMDKDIAKLADVLGHSSIETTRIYIMTTGKEHMKKIEQLGLVQ